jgi:hypothetical protein
VFSARNLVTLVYFEMKKCHIQLLATPRDFCDVTSGQLYTKMLTLRAPEGARKFTISYKIHNLRLLCIFLDNQ